MRRYFGLEPEAESLPGIGRVYLAGWLIFMSYLVLQLVSLVQPDLKPWLHWHGNFVLFFIAMAPAHQGLSNLILMFKTQGRRLLDQRARVQGILFGVIVTGVALSWFSYERSGLRMMAACAYWLGILLAPITNSLMRSRSLFNLWVCLISLVAFLSMFLLVNGHEDGLALIFLGVTLWFGWLLSDRRSSSDDTGSKQA